MTLINLIGQAFYNVKTYGATGNGSTDDTTAISNARSAANSAGGGIVFYPAGTYICGPQSIYNNVTDMGAGPGASILKLKNGSNADFFSANTGSINLSAANATGSNGGSSRWGLRDIALDCNKANQTAGYGIRVYGLDYLIENVEILNAFSDGALLDWNGASLIPGSGDQMVARLINVNIHDCGGAPLRIGGPHDSQLINILAWNCGSHGIHICPNATGVLMTQCHPYFLASGAVGFLIEAGGVQLNNCMMEGSDTTQVVILANDCSIVGGHVFDLVPGNTSVGIRLGQNAGGTPLAGQILQSGGVTTAVSVAGTNINTKFTTCEGGSMNFVNESNNVVHALSYGQVGGFVAGGNYPNSTDMIFVQTHGIANDFSINSESTIEFASDSSAAFLVRTTTGAVIFSVNPAQPALDLPNAAQLRIYSDVYTTLKASLNADGNGSLVSKGNISVGQSASAASLANSGTISVGSLGSSVVAPTANVTGIILQAGSVAGQRVSVINQSSFTVTFAASGTSHVAAGTGVVIAANGRREFEWNAINSLWY